MSLLHIKNGRVYDPKNSVDGDVCDIWIQDGRVVPKPGGEVKADKAIDCSGMVVMRAVSICTATLPGRK